MLPNFEGNLYKREPVNIRTNEGPAAVNELIEFLSKQESIPPTEWQQALQGGSRDHVLNMGPTGATGHTGLDGSTPK